MSLNLPYSVTRGEQVVVQAIVFNYMDQDMDVSDDFISNGVYKVSDIVRF